MRVILPLRQQKQQQQSQSSSGASSPNPLDPEVLEVGGEGAILAAAAAEVEEPSDPSISLAVDSTTAYEGVHQTVDLSASSSAISVPLCACQPKEDEVEAPPLERGKSGSSESAAKKRRVPSPALAVEVAPSSSSAAPSWNSPRSSPTTDKKSAAAVELSSSPVESVELPPAQKPSGDVVRSFSATASASGKDDKSRKRRHVGGAAAVTESSYEAAGLGTADSKPSSVPLGKVSASKPRHQQVLPAAAASQSSSASHQSAFDHATSSASSSRAAPRSSENKTGKMGRLPRHDDDVREDENDTPPIEVRRSNYAREDDRDPQNDENDPASPWGGVGGRYPNDEGVSIPQQHQNSSSCSSSSSSAALHIRHQVASAAAAHQSVSTSTFGEALKKRGLEMAEQEGDGNCLFRAVSLQVYGDSNNHGEVRKRALDFMAKDEAHFSQFITDEPFHDYLNRKRIDGVHGNNPEIQAISELYNRPVEVFVPDSGATPINIFHAEYKTSDTPIRLSYHDGNHYNAVIDPLCPTAGLGLGLPGLEPGLADKMQMDKAKEESDRLQVQKIAAESHKDEVDQAMKESMRSHDLMYQKKKAFGLSDDLEATDFDLEQAVLESSLESYMKEQGRKQSHRDRRRQGSASPPSSSNRYSSAMSSSSSSRVQEGPMPSVASMAAAAAPASAASARAGAADLGDDDGVPSHLLQGDEYPQTVQELVMNGFELSKVVRAYDLVGDNFDALLAFLMSNAS